MSVVGYNGHGPDDLATTVPDRRFGHLDWDVPIAGLGCDNFGVRLDRHQSVSVVHAALDVGVQFFDTARAYGKGRSEEFLGEALKGCREEVRIATKFGTPFEVAGDEVKRVSDGGFASPDMMRASLEASLRALNVDHIDLFQIHHYDPGTPLEDMLLAMDGLVQAGKVLALGCSNFSIEQVLHVAKLCEGLSVEAIASVQFEWSLVNRVLEADIRAGADELGFSVLPYYPLAGGLLAGRVSVEGEVAADSRLRNPRYARFLGRENIDLVRRVASWGDAHGRTLLQVALGWLAAQQCVGCVIAGASTPEQVRENVQSTGVRLSADEVREIDELTAAPVIRASRPR
jgi:aryl-alcohol dehydrogenase-like predicted oxidoreductase